MRAPGGFEVSRFSFHGSICLNCTPVGWRLFQFSIKIMPAVIAQAAQWTSVALCNRQRAAFCAVSQVVGMFWSRTNFLHVHCMGHCLNKIYRPEVFLQDKRNGAAQTRMHAGSPWQNAGLRFRWRPVTDNFVDDGTDSAPGTCYFSHHHDHIWRKTGNQQCNSNTQKMG